MSRVAGGNTVSSINFGCGGIGMLVWVYFVVCWVVNLFKFIGCDFDAPYKEGVLHGIGVFTLFGSGITAWF
jgi:hypothetical protein